MSTSANTDTDANTNARLRTQYSEVTVVCPGCRAQWSPSVVTIVNIGTDPQGREGILRGSIHRPACPRCKRIMELDHIFSVYDPERQLVVQVRPKWEFNAGGGEELYWKRLEDFVLKHAEDEVVVDVVFGYADLIDKYLGGQAAVEAARARADAERAAGHKPGTLLGNDANTNPDSDNSEGNTTA
jgi:hypothetical protein